MNLLVTVPIILNQAVGYCFHYFESGSWSLFLLYWIRLLVNVPIILDQAVGYCSGDRG
jgi:hydrogenase-4 membrane subunit HyfE